MSDILYSDMTYCTLCDRYFPGEEARAQHVQLALNHPECNTCERRFANKNSLRNHWVYSRKHNYCAVCERDFRTAAGLRVHIEYAAVHRDDSDDDSDDDDIDDSSEGWEDELGSRVFPDEDEGNGLASNNGDEDLNEADYWTEDEEDDFEEERETYYGFARVPSTPSHRTQDGTNEVVNNSEQLEEGVKPASQTALTDNQAPAAGVFFSCPLCLEAPNESSATQCGHLFCTP
ncbi:hypothetical protein EW026_g6423 [Hermanssonia centrifuga]|uniref:C2H2-type domain-containing protein n=1 Tax=Hermanssonia centrifuga TaxID=98765 RepID=A0A4V3X9R5_9APHY|nr:hypothetical protein EW026_g6423 [Hermanssonia centrifuga]